MIRPAWASNPGLADHRSQAARTAKLPTVPPGQAPQNVNRVPKFLT